MRIQSSASRSSLDEIVLFPFDDYAFPLQRGVELHLNSHRATCGRTQIECPPGSTARPKAGGFKQLVTWGGKDAISSLESRIRVRVDFSGIRFEDVRLYAIYLNEVT